MFSFVTFASFLAGLSDLSLRNENDNSVKTETDQTLDSKNYSAERGDKM